MKSRRVSFHCLTAIFQACVIVAICLLQIHTQAQPTAIYSTGFEPAEGFDATFTLIEQGGWIGTDSNGNGIVTNFFTGHGQQAYVGFFPLTNTDGTLNVWRPLNYDPVAAGKPVVKFSVDMSIFSSTTTNHDCFRWSVYNTNNGGTRLFSLDFDAATTNINYRLDDGDFVPTQFVFEKTFGSEEARIYTLVVTMNFASNLWSATLEDVTIVNSKPITTRGTALNLGDIDAVWVNYVVGRPGDNFMVFDDYKVTAEAAPATPFQLETLGHLPNGLFLLRLTGEQGRNYAIEASTNLISWTSIKTNNATDGTFDFVDSSATGFARRFYRARFVP